MQDPELLQQLRTQYQQLTKDQQSIMIASLGADSQAKLSYAPFVYIDQKVYVFISELAAHTQQLLLHPRCQLMLIQDEQQATNIFARLRVTFDAQAQVISPTDKQYETYLNQLQVKCGSTMKVLRGLGDFKLFEFELLKATLVRGFGQAYYLNLEDLSFLPITAKDINPKA